jgi:hypothetical protein
LTCAGARAGGSARAGRGAGVVPAGGSARDRADGLVQTGRAGLCTRVVGCAGGRARWWARSGSCMRVVRWAARRESCTRRRAAGLCMHLRLVPVGKRGWTRSGATHGTGYARGRAHGMGWWMCAASCIMSCGWTGSGSCARVGDGKLTSSSVCCRLDAASEQHG